MTKATWSWVVLLVWAASGAFAGCQSPVDIDGLTYACTNTSACKNGYFCGDEGTCVPMGTPQTKLDAATADSPDSSGDSGATDAAPGTDALGDTSAADSPDAADLQDQADSGDGADSQDAPDDLGVADALDQVETADSADALPDAGPADGQDVAADGAGDVDSAGDMDSAGDAVGAADSAADGAVDTAPAQCVPANCDDGNPCTTDTCGNSVCSHVNSAAGTACPATGICEVAGVCADGKCTAGPAKLWAKTLTAPDYETAKGIAIGGDGTMLAVGLRHEFGSPDDLIVWHLDAAGNQLAAKTFGAPGTIETGADVIALTGGGFAVLGSKRVKSGDPADFWLLRLDAKLNKLWEATFGTAEKDDVPWALAQTTEGFALVGSTSAANGSTDAWIVAISASGSLLWTKAVGDAALSETAMAVQVAADGALLVAGQRKSATTGLDPYVFRLAMPGKTVQWETAVVTPGIDDYALAMAQGPGGLMLGCYADGGSAGDGKAEVLLVDAATGKLNWSRLLGSYPIQLASDLTATADGGAILAGMAESGSLTGLWMMRVNANGWPLWERKHVLGQGSDGNSIALMPDGGAVAVGGTYSSVIGVSDLAMVRTDAFGNASCASSGICAEKALSACSDGQECTSDDCTAGTACLNQPLAASCDDGNLCTADTCQQAGCSHVPMADASPCVVSATCSLGDICLSGTCTAQPPLWSKPLAVTGTTSSVAAVALLGSDLVAVGQCGSQGGDVCVWRVHASGQIAWQKAFGTAAAESGLDIAVLTDNTIAIVADAAGKTWLLHLAGDGKQLASAVDPVPGTKAVAIAAGPNGGAVVAGYSTGVASDGWYARINSDFTVSFETKVGSVLNADRLADVGLANGQLWAVGYTSNLTAKVQWAIRVDNTNKVEEFTLDSSSIGLTALHVAPLGGEIVAVGTATSGAPVYLRLAAGVPGATKISSPALGQTTPVAIAGYLPLTAAGGGAAVLSAQKLWRYGENGILAWQSGLAAQETGVSFTAMANAGKALWLGGTKGGTTAWLARRDSFGNSNCAESGPCHDLTPSSCTDGIPCYADTCSAAVYAEKCPQGGCQAISACGHTAVPGCN